jgi:hypothetical protein
MKRLIPVAAIAAAAFASGCATYDSPYGTTYYDAYGRPVVTPMATRADGVLNPTVPVAEGDNGAVPYRQYSMFFKDRGLHQEVPSALAPKIIVGPPATTPAG